MKYPFAVPSKSFGLMRDCRKLIDAEAQGKGISIIRVRRIWLDHTAIPNWTRSVTVDPSRDRVSFESGSPDFDDEDGGWPV